MTKDKGQGTNPIVDVELICAESFVRHAEYFDSLGSTNDRAAELAGQPDLPTPALVVARLQTAGRGRGAKSWWSDDAALTFSLVFENASLGITSRDWPRLSLATAVAAGDALDSELKTTPQSAIRNRLSLSSGPTTC